MKTLSSTSGTRIYFTGPKGGFYYLDANKKKHYVKTVPDGAIFNHFNCKQSNTPHVKTCCVCGKPLTRMDIEYYDLSSYCIKCAIADGIRSSYE